MIRAINTQGFLNQTGVEGTRFHTAQQVLARRQSSTKGRLFTVAKLSSSPFSHVLHLLYQRLPAVLQIFCSFFTFEYSCLHLCTLHLDIYRKLYFDIFSLCFIFHFKFFMLVRLFYLCLVMNNFFNAMYSFHEKLMFDSYQTSCLSKRSNRFITQYLKLSHILPIYRLHGCMLPCSC